MMYTVSELRRGPIASEPNRQGDIAPARLAPDHLQASCAQNQAVA